MNVLFQQGISLTEGGASRGVKGYFVKDDDSFCVSMIVAFSHKKSLWMYGHQALDKYEFCQVFLPINN